MVWHKIEHFMNRQDASQWIMAGLTVVIIILTTVTTCFTCQQISIYKVATHRELRAYMSVLEPKIDSIRGKFYATYIEGNLGNTPAYDVCAEKRLDLLTKDSVPDPREFHTSSAQIFVGAHVQTNYPILSRDLTKEDIDGFKYHNLRVYFYGKISYTDIFRKAQWLTFCYEYVFSTERFYAYPKYNDASRD